MNCSIEENTRNVWVVYCWSFVTTFLQLSMFHSLVFTWLDACTDALCSNEFLFSICEYFKFTVTSDLTKTKFFRVFYQILTTLVWRELPVIWGKVEIYLGKIYLWKNIYQCFSLVFLCKSHIPGNSQLICADNICPLSTVSLLQLKYFFSGTWFHTSSCFAVLFKPFSFFGKSFYSDGQWLLLNNVW